MLPTEKQHRIFTRKMNRKMSILYYLNTTVSMRQKMENEKENDKIKMEKNSKNIVTV